LSVFSLFSLSLLKIAPKFGFHFALFVFLKRKILGHFVPKLDDVFDLLQGFANFIFRFDILVLFHLVSFSMKGLLNLEFQLNFPFLCVSILISQLFAIRCLSLLIILKFYFPCSTAVSVKRINCLLLNSYISNVLSLFR
jgi:hypothetical protein